MGWLFPKLAWLFVATRKIPIKIHFAEKFNPRGSKLNNAGCCVESSAERCSAFSHSLNQARLPTLSLCLCCIPAETLTGKKLRRQHGKRRAGDCLTGTKGRQRSEGTGRGCACSGLWVCGAGPQVVRTGAESGRPPAHPRLADQWK